ncbi:MAG: cadherin domain-containing protein [Hymenobacteraceae bacterium]|nr:cadherin domain-containing protein [Hymenobacteraceae bacterium]
MIALAVLPNGDVVAGGLFMDAGGNPNANRVARWDGTAWQALGTSTNGSVRALGVANGKIYAGGTFTATGDVSKPLSRFGIYTFDVAPTALGLSPQSVTENTAGGTAIGTFSTTDADAGDTFTYSLVSGTGSTDNGAFSISGGQLLITASPDYEAQASYAIRVRSTDQGGLFTEQTFTVSVLDVAEDLVVSTAQTVPAGLYHNITITGTGDATLGGNITVTGTLLVRNAFHDGCFTVSGSGAFTLAARAVLYICSPQGISASGATGSIQVMGARTFSPHAVYVYEGTVAQVTGSGLPGQVYVLNQFNPVSLTLSQPVALRSALSMARPGNLVLNGNSFTLLSNADTTAFVANFNTGVVAGAATVQRYLTPGTAPTLAYRHLSAPVTNTTLNDLTAPGFAPVVSAAYNTSPTPTAVRPYPNVFGFNEARLPASTNFASGYFSLTALAAPLVSGRGYSVALAPTTLDFVGTLGSGSEPLSLTRTGATDKSGWHLLGNPYPQPLDWDNVTVPAGMSPTIWVWKSTGGTNGAYRTRQSSGGGTGTGTLLNGILPIGQGFLAQVTGAGPVSFSFENAHRAAPFADGPLYRAAVALAPAPAAPMRVLGLTLVGASAEQTDATFVQLVPGATLTATDRLDAVAPARNVGVPTLRTLGPNGEELGISAMPETALTTGTTVELLLDVPAAGAYVLHVGEQNGLTEVALLDRATTTRYDLTTQPTVTFSATGAGEVRGRFALVFGQRVTGTAAARAPSAFTLAPNPARGSVRLSGGAGQPITLCDATGRTVRTWAARAASPTERSQELSLTGLAPGVYMVRTGLTTQRLVVE